MGRDASLAVARWKVSIYDESDDRNIGSPCEFFPSEHCGSSGSVILTLNKR